MWSYTEEQSIRNSYVINIILKLISKFQLINFFLFLREYRKYLLPLQHNRKKEKKYRKMIRKTKEHRGRKVESWRGRKSRLHTWTSALPSNARFHNPCTWRWGRGEEGKNPWDVLSLLLDRSIRPTPLRTIYSHGQKAGVKKKGQRKKMYRYYPSSSLDVTFASLYELGLESETESLIPSIDEKSTFKVATLSMLFVLRSRV